MVSGRLGMPRYARYRRAGARGSAAPPPGLNRSTGPSPRHSPLSSRPRQDQPVQRGRGHSRPEPPGPESPSCRRCTWSDPARPAAAASGRRSRASLKGTPLQENGSKGHGACLQPTVGTEKGVGHHTPLSLHSMEAFKDVTMVVMPSARRAPCRIGSVADRCPGSHQRLTNSAPEGPLSGGNVQGPRASHPWMGALRDGATGPAFPSLQQAESPE